jgi:hypothetical protein
MLWKELIRLKIKIYWGLYEVIFGEQKGIEVTWYGVKNQP